MVVSNKSSDPSVDHYSEGNCRIRGASLASFAFLALLYEHISNLGPHLLNACTDDWVQDENTLSW